MKKQILLILAVALGLGACCKKDADEYYQLHPIDPEHPQITNPGEVTVIPTLPGEETPPQDSQVTVTLTGADGKTFTLNPGQSTDAEAGTYTATTLTVVPDNDSDTQPGTGITTLPQGTQITPEGIVSLPVATDGRIDNLPQLFAGTGTVTVSNNKSVNVNIPQQPMTRPVQVGGLLQGIDPTVLKSITVKLEGIAASRAIDNPFASNQTAKAAAGISPDRLQTKADDGVLLYYVDYNLSSPSTPQWQNLFRLLGIDPAAKQTLRIVIEYKDPGSSTYSYQADVTALLAGFNNGSASLPAVLNVTLSFGIDSVTGSITGWTPGWEEEVPGQ